MYTSRNEYFFKNKIHNLNSSVLKFKTLYLKQKMLSLLTILPKTFSILDYTSAPYNGCKKAKRYKKRSF
jgi:hypothetical protein